MLDYLHADSHFNNKQFEGQFRITPSIFEYIFRCLVVIDKYWHGGKDCTKQTKIKPEVKLLAVLKVISFGVLFGNFCE